MTTKDDLWITLVKIHWRTSGTTRHSGAGVNTVHGHFDNLLVDVSQIVREIDPIKSTYRVANCTIKVADTTALFRKRRVTDAWKGTKVEIFFGSKASDYADMAVQFTGEIYEWSAEKLVYTIKCADISFHDLQQPMSGRYNTGDFSDMDIDIAGKLVPLVLGRMDVSEEYGAFPVEQVEATGDVYLISRRLCESIDNVYHSGSEYGGAYWAELTGQTYGELTDCHCIDFTVAGDPGTNEVTIRADGYSGGVVHYERGAGMLQAFLYAIGLAAADLDTDSFDEAIRRQASTYWGGLFVDDAEKTILYYMDLICATFALIHYRTKAGLIACRQFAAEDRGAYASPDHYFDDSHIAGLRMLRNPNVATRFICSYQRNYAKDIWEHVVEDEDEYEKKRIGMTISEDFEAWAARDADVANQSLRNKRYLMRESHHFSEFSLSARDGKDIELAENVALTHPDGISEDGEGYKKTPGRVTRIVLNPELENPTIDIRAMMLEHCRPTDFLDLILWLDASKIDYLDDGDEVWAWHDWSGKGYTAYQNTSSNRPLFRKYAMNNRGAIEFDGNDNFLSIADNDDLDDIVTENTVTMFAAIRNASGANNPLLSKGDGGANIEFIWKLDDYYLDGGWTGIACDPTSGIHIIAQRIIIGNHWAYRDGAIVDNVIDTYTASAGAYDFYIGRDGSGGSNYLSGQIAEIAVFLRGLDPDEIKALFHYMAAKYGITDQIKEVSPL